MTQNEFAGPVRSNANSQLENSLARRYPFGIRFLPTPAHPQQVRVQAAAHFDPDFAD